MQSYEDHQGTWSVVVWTLYVLGFRSLGQVIRLVNGNIIEKFNTRLARARL